MQSPNTNIPPNPYPTNDSTKANRSKKYGIIALVIVALIIGSVLLVGSLAILAQNDQQNNSFLFKGAYASYYGETTIINQKLGVQFRLEIVDINGTHFKGLTYIKIDSNNAGTIYEDQNTEWAPLSVDTMDYTVEDMMFVSKKEDSVYFPNLGTKDCLIYEYQYKAGTGIDGSMTIYLEPNSGWAYRIELTVKVSGFEMDFDLPLESTNIHALS